MIFKPNFRNYHSYGKMPFVFLLAYDYICRGIQICKCMYVGMYVVHTNSIDSLSAYV